MTRSKILAALVLTSVASGQVARRATNAPQLNPPKSVVESSRISLQVGVENPAARAGTPIFVKVLWKNNTISAISVPFIWGLFELTALDNGGKPVVKTPYFVHLLDPETPIFSTQQIQVPARGTYLQTIEISSLFDIKDPGTYSVQASQQWAVSLTTEERATSGIATFTVFAPGSPQLQIEAGRGIQPPQVMFPGDVPNKVRIGLEPPQNSITVHEPVILSLSFKNITGQTIELPGGLAQDGERDYRVSISGPNGEISQVFDPNDVQPLDGYGVDRLAPGATRNQQIILNKWTLFDEPGHYRIAIFVPQSGEPAVVDVDVSPRDPRRLEDVCRSIEAQADQKGNFFVEEALGLMRDEIAVRHLAQQRGDPNLQNALAAVGTLDAVAALKDMLFDRDRDISSRARDALTQMKDRAKSDEIKKAAKAALTQP